MYANRDARTPPHRGSAAIAVTLALTLVAATLVASTGREVEARRVRQLERQQALLGEARDRILAWVSPRLADFAAPADPATVLAQSGVDARSGIRLGIGPLRSDSGVQFRSMALWLPATPGDAPRPDGAGGFLAGADPARFLVFSTRELEQAARGRSLAVLERLAQSAESRFAAKAGLDPDHRFDINWFRAPDGVCRIGADQIPCSSELAVDSWPTVDRLRTQSLVADDPAAGGAGLDRNGWGGPNFWSNDADPAWFAHPPYSMAFATLTPSGERLVAHAVQPL
jgi:hypothetical protein